MPEARIDQRGWFVCGEWKYNPSNDAVHFGRLDKVIAYGNWLDDLYAVLHARHMAQHYNAELMARIEKAVEAVKDDDLYGGEG